MFEKNRQPFLAPEGEDGKGSGDSKEKGTATVEDQIKAAVEKEVQGLKRTNEALKGEKGDLKTKLDAALKIVEALGGEDGAKALVALRDRLNSDEVGKLLAEGKHEEWYEARVSGLKGEYKQTIDKLTKDVTTEKEARGRSESAFANLKLEIAVREACRVNEGFRKEAVEDALLWAQNRFEFDHKRGIPVRKDENGTVILGKDGQQPVTVSEDLEATKETRRHWWEGSAGAGATGGTGGAGRPSDTKNMSMKDWREYRKTEGVRDGLDAQIPG
jgi:hypothetical protein